MKLYVACSSVGMILILNFIVFQHYTLNRYVNISDSSIIKNSILHDNVRINPQEFVFFNAVDLADFECKKNERAGCLLEQLSSMLRTKTIQCNVFNCMPLRAIAMRNHILVHNKQQFGIPEVVGKNTLVKKIATKQLLEKNIFSKKQSMLSALATLL